MSKTENYIKFNAIRRYVHDMGVDYIQADAVNLIVKHLHAEVKELIDKGRKFSEHSNRKKISEADIKMAISMS